MTAATFILMYKEPAASEASAAALKFFDWAYATATRWLKSSTTFRCPTTSSSLVHEEWKTSRTRPASLCLR